MSVYLLLFLYILMYTATGVSVQYKHRGHSLTAGMSGGIPIHVQERLEERMRKVRTFDIHEHLPTCKPDYLRVAQ